MNIGTHIQERWWQPRMYDRHTYYPCHCLCFIVHNVSSFMFLILKHTEKLKFYFNWEGRNEEVGWIQTSRILITKEPTEVGFLLHTHMLHCIEKLFYIAQPSKITHISINHWGSDCRRPRNVSYRYVVSEIQKANVVKEDFHWVLCPSSLHPG